MSRDNPKSILVVEDDEDISFTVLLALETQGYTVHSATNGREALEHIQNKGMPDLILLDMKMPVMDGWQFSTEFNLRYKGSTPIVVMTAAADAEKRAGQIHPEAWIEKPFTLNTLLAIVSTTLSKNRF